jgi:hypothetical protein
MCFPIWDIYEGKIWHWKQFKLFNTQKHLFV